LRQLLALHCSLLHVSLLSAAKVVSARLDFDGNFVDVVSLKDVHIQFKAWLQELQQLQAAERTGSPQQQGDIPAHSELSIEDRVRKSVLEANWRHYETPEAADPKVLQQRLNAAVLEHLPAEEITRRNLWFSAA
jgi:hypothetical protein